MANRRSCSYDLQVKQTSVGNYKRFLAFKGNYLVPMYGPISVPIAICFDTQRSFHDLKVTRLRATIL